METKINYDFISEYIKNTISPNDAFLTELEFYAKENHVPIIQPEVAKFIYVLGKIIRPRRILEIGTAIGYSAILMSRFLQSDGEIITIERDAKMVEIAKQNIKKANLEKTIKIIEGDALEVLQNISGKFDMIFIDAAKGQYLEFLNNCLNRVDAGGILLSDNVLFKGMVANDELVDKRHKTIVKRMREYLTYICNHEQLDTSIIPIGDGVALSYKRS